MQRVSALGVSAQTGYQQASHVSPGALVDGLMDVHIFGRVGTVGRAVRREAHSLGGATSGGGDLPTLVREADLHHFPELAVLDAVVSMQVVHIKTTDVTQDFLGTLVTPVLL